MKEVSILELLKAGVHFGHQTSRWHPKMKPYIFGTRKSVHIIDLEMTKSKLDEVREYLNKIGREGKTILFLGTKRQVKDIVKKYAREVNMPYITGRWIGGAFTNFKSVGKLINSLNDLKEKKQKGELKKYTKKEQLEFQKEIDRLEKLVGGLSDMKKLPEAVYIVDIKEEATALREANKMGIKVVAMVDTNANPQKADYYVPANDDASKSVELITRLMAEAIAEGQGDSQKEDKKPTSGGSAEGRKKDK